MAKFVVLPVECDFGIAFAYNLHSKIAEHIAKSAPKGRSILVDAFAGAGGNTIAFALSGRWKRVYAIEKDPAVLQCAKHNAKVYGVENKITWFEGDCFEIIKNQLKDLAPYSVLFGSPPWGGKYSLRSLEKVYGANFFLRAWLPLR